MMRAKAVLLLFFGVFLMLPPAFVGAAGAVTQTSSGASVVVMAKAIFQPCLCVFAVNTAWPNKTEE